MRPRQRCITYVMRGSESTWHVLVLWVAILLTILLPACARRAPLVRVQITDATGASLVFTNPEISYLHVGTISSDEYRNRYKAGGLLRTDRTFLPWNGFKSIQIGPSGKTDAGIDTYYSCQVVLPSGGTQAVELLDTAQGDIQGDTPLGRARIPLGDVKTLEVLPGVIAGPRPPPDESSFYLRIRLVEGGDYDASGEVGYPPPSNGRYLLSVNVSDPGIRVYMGKAQVLLGWRSLRKVSFEKNSGEVRVEFQDGREGRYQAVQPASFFVFPDQGSKRQYVGLSIISSIEVRKGTRN